MEFIGDRIKRFRKENGLTQVQFAKMAGVSVYYLTRWEARWAAPNAEQMKKIQKALGESKTAHNIIRARSSADVSQEELAEESGLSLSEIANIECAAIMPTKDQISKIAQALGVDPSQLTGKKKAVCLHEKLKEYREENNLTQKKFAKMLGISTGHLGKIETASSTPSAKVFERMAEVMGVTVEELKGGKG